MFLNCPSCDARFRVRHEMFADGPRKVRCARCGHKWTGMPESLAEETVPEAVELDPVSEPVAEAPDTETEAFHPVEPTGERELRAVMDVPPLSEAAMAMEQKVPRRGTPLWVWIGWLLLVGLMAGTVLAFVFARAPLVAAWPPIERLYDLTGTAMAKSADAGVVIRTLNSSLSNENGQSRMTVEIMIENQTSEAADMPVAAVELFDKSGKLFHTELVRLPGAELSAGEKRPDRLTLPKVPDRTDSVRVVTHEGSGKE